MRDYDESLENKGRRKRYILFYGIIIGVVALFAFGLYKVIGESDEIRLVEKKLNQYPKVQYEVEDYKLLKSTTIVREYMYKGYDRIDFVTGEYDGLSDVYIAKVTYVDEENLRYTIEQPVKVKYIEDGRRPKLQAVKVTDKLDSIGDYVNPVLYVEKS